MENKKVEYSTATPDMVWAALLETQKRQQETERIMQESKVEYDRMIKEMKESQAKTERLMGKWATNHGDFAEEYFANSFERGQRNFFGEKFDSIKKNVRGLEIDAEYDILLVNGKSIGIIEVKFKAHENDIPEVLKKAETFRVNYPKYADHQIYLGLASLSFYPELENKCIKEGIAVIKQVGDTIVINDKHLKVF